MPATVISARRRYWSAKRSRSVTTSPAGPLDRLEGGRVSRARHLPPSAQVHVPGREGVDHPAISCAGSLAAVRVHVLSAWSSGAERQLPPLSDRGKPAGVSPMASLGFLVSGQGNLVWERPPCHRWPFRFLGPSRRHQPPSVVCRLTTIHTVSLDEGEDGTFRPFAGTLWRERGFHAYPRNHAALRSGSTALGVARPRKRPPSAAPRASARPAPSDRTSRSSR
jgi:hypothetical protein